MNRSGQALELLETETDVIPAWLSSHSCATDDNQYTKEWVVTSAVEVTVTGEATLDGVAREGL